MFKRKKSSRGFTLIELLVVIAIIGILAAIIAPNAFKAIEKSKVAAVESDYKAVKSATLMYYSDTGTWPTADNDFNNNDHENAIFVTDDGTTGWDGPYLEKWPTRDPWGGGYTLATGTWDSEEFVAFAASKVTDKSARKVLNDLGADQVETAPAGNFTGGEDTVLLFKIGMNQ